MTTSDPVQHAVRRPSSVPPRRATVAEWLAEPEEKGAELIHGRIVYKAQPKPLHAMSQGRMSETLGPFNRRPGGVNRPGGWWILPEVDILLNGQGVRPDLAGWRRDRLSKLPEPSSQGVVTDHPDWIAEILSTSTATRDLDDKLQIYHAAGVAHYWILDPQNRMLIVYRHTPDGYLFVRAAKPGTHARLEPFDALELSIGALFGDDEDDEEIEEAQAVENP